MHLNKTNFFLNNLAEGHEAIFMFAYSQPAFTMFKFNNRNTRARCKICSKLTIKTSE